MSYDYQKERANLFTEDGIELLRAVEACCNAYLEVAGAFEASKVRPHGIAGWSSWEVFAALDYLVEKEALREIPQHRETFGQNRVFVRGVKAPQ